MGHVQVLRKGKLQHTIPMHDRPINYVNTKFTGIDSNFLKVKKLKLDRKLNCRSGCILYFKGPGNSLIWNEFVNYTISFKHDISVGVGRFKLITPVLFALKF